MEQKSSLVLNDFLDIIRSINHKFLEYELTLPFRDTCIDSIDLISIKVEIEKFMGISISDTKWYSFKSLNDVFDYCKNSHIILPKKKSIKYEAIISRENIINMPQMANCALSENWLFKELGDIHWTLLSNGLDLKSSLILDEFNERLYATFTRIKLSCSSLKNFNENEKIVFNGQIDRYGNNTYLTKILGSSKNDSISATLMTSFTKRGNAQNESLQKSVPNVKEIKIPEIKYLPIFLNEYKLLSKKLLCSYSLFDTPFDLSYNNIFSTKYTINPFYDINGVGLLYFSSYPIISDFCQIEYFRNIHEFSDFAKNYFTITRDIFYYANCGIRDEIIFNLNNYEILPDNKIKIFTSLYRKSDNHIMADIFTIKVNIFN